MTLSNEQIDDWANNTSCEFAKALCAQARRANDLEAQLASAVEALRKCDCQHVEDCEACPACPPCEIVSNLSTTAQAYKERVRADVIDECVEVVKQKHDALKDEPMPYMIPRACPSKSHYRERTQGALSGYLNSIKALQAMKGER